MNLLKIVEFIFSIIILVFVAIFAIFILLCIEVYSFLVNIEAPLYFRIITLTVMALIFLFIVRGIIFKAEEFNFHE